MGFKSLVLLCSLLLSQVAHGGYVELGFNGNYRKLNLPSDTGRDSFDATTSYTASIAYYFAEMAALELNNTRGQSERFVPSSLVDSRTVYDFNLIGLDLVLTLAKRNESFVPYIKAGVAYFANKDVTYEFLDNVNPQNNRSDKVNLGTAYVPSVGFGVRIRLTDTIAIKLGLEGWTSDSLETDPRWDIAGRAGISWFL